MINYNKIKRLCDIAVEFKDLEESINDLIQKELSNKNIAKECNRCISKLEAVRLFKSRTNCSLMEAKNWVEKNTLWIKS